MLYDKCTFFILFAELQNLVVYISDSGTLVTNTPVTLNILTCSLYCYYCCLVTKSCLTLCDPMDCSTPGFPVLHSLLLPSPLAVNLFQQQGLFQWGGSFPMSQLFTSSGQSIGASALASVLLMTTQDWFLAPCLSQINSRSMTEQMSVLNTF